MVRALKPREAETFGGIDGARRERAARAEAERARDVVGALARRQHRGHQHHAAQHRDELDREQLEWVASATQRARELRERGRLPACRQAFRDFEWLGKLRRPLLAEIRSFYRRALLKMNRELVERIRDRAQVAAVTRDQQFGSALRQLQTEAAREALRIRRKLIVEGTDAGHPHG